MEQHRRIQVDSPIILVAGSKFWDGHGLASMGTDFDVPALPVLYIPTQKRRIRTSLLHDDIVPPG